MTKSVSNRREGKTAKPSFRANRKPSFWAGVAKSGPQNSCKVSSSPTTPSQKQNTISRLWRCWWTWTWAPSLVAHCSFKGILRFFILSSALLKPKFISGPRRKKTENPSYRVWENVDRLKLSRTLMWQDKQIEYLEEDEEGEGCCLGKRWWHQRGREERFDWWIETKNNKVITIEFRARWNC